jgi:hypothetical protein
MAVALTPIGGQSSPDSAEYAPPLAKNAHNMSRPAQDGMMCG